MSDIKWDFMVDILFILLRLQYLNFSFKKDKKEKKNPLIFAMNFNELIR